jgi:hypothetical protein
LQPTFHLPNEIIDLISYHCKKFHDLKQTCLYWIPLNINKWNDIYNGSYKYQYDTIEVELELEEPTYKHNSYNGTYHLKQLNELRFMAGIAGKTHSNY